MGRPLIPPITDRDTRFSRIPATASTMSFCCLCRRPTRSSSCVLQCATSAVSRAACPPPSSRNGYLAQSATNRPCASSPRSIRTPAPCWRAIASTRTFRRPSLSWMSTPGREHGPATARSFSDATARSPRRPRWNARRGAAASARGSTLAPPCKRSSTFNRARRRKSFSCSAKLRMLKKRDDS